jgi:hypothetical protein
MRFTGLDFRHKSGDGANGTADPIERRSRLSVYGAPAISAVRPSEDFVPRWVGIACCNRAYSSVQRQSAIHEFLKDAGEEFAAIAGPRIAGRVDLA